MKRHLFIACTTVLLLLASCKDKKNPPAAGVVSDKNDFFTSFKTLKLPTEIKDSTILKNDSVSIGYAVLHQFVPDSILHSYLPDTAKSRITPVGRIEKEGNTYLLIQFAAKKTAKLGVFVFKNKKLVAHQPLENERSGEYNNTLSINKEPTFILSREKSTGNNFFYTKTGYAFNEELRGFLVIINETNEPSSATAVINPLDTLPALRKWSGDYAVNDKNFISIRDGRSENVYNFFIYFEKDKGECKAELKGELTLQSKDKAVFSKNGDPCIIEFGFTENTVKVKEQGSCGNHRGIKCYFNDTYKRKKPALKTPKKK
jgi:hypothetical protein